MISGRAFLDETNFGECDVILRAKHNITTHSGRNPLGREQTAKPQSAARQGGRHTKRPRTNSIHIESEERALIPTYDN